MGLCVHDACGYRSRGVAHRCQSENQTKTKQTRLVEEDAEALGWGEEMRAVEREKAASYAAYERLKREHDATDRYDQVGR